MCLFKKLKSNFKKNKACGSCTAKKANCDFKKSNKSHEVHKNYLKENNVIHLNRQKEDQDYFNPLGCA